jgi:hypothetical protein
MATIAHEKSDGSQPPPYGSQSPPYGSQPPPCKVKRKEAATCSVLVIIEGLDKQHKTQQSLAPVVSRYRKWYQFGPFRKAKVAFPGGRLVFEPTAAQQEALGVCNPKQHGRISIYLVSQKDEKSATKSWCAENFCGLAQIGSRPHHFLWASSQSNTHPNGSSDADADADAKVFFKQHNPAEGMALWAISFDKSTIANLISGRH